MARTVAISFLAVALLSGGCTAGDGETTRDSLADTTTTAPATTTTAPTTTTTTPPTTTTAPTTTTTTPPTTTTAPTTTTTTTGTITIMAIGDSITQGSRGWPTYRCYLDRALRDGGVPFDLVGVLSDPFNGQPYGCPTAFDTAHEGRWGWRADQVVGVVTESVASLQPDIALIHLGSNDVLQGQATSETVEELGGLVTGLQAVSPDITILIAQIIPCSLPECATIPALNEGIALLGDLSTAESTVIVVDMATDYPFENLRDGVHPDDEGDQLIASRWMQAMQQYGLL